MANQGNLSTFNRWLAKLTALRPAIGRGLPAENRGQKPEVNRSENPQEMSGPAPHKPLLLLSLIDLAAEGELPGRSLTRTPDLALRFRSYGTLVAERWPNRLDLKLPFFHLSSQGFWTPLAIGRERATDPEHCVACELDPEFHGLLADPEFRLQARQVLISRYFEPVEQVALFETLGIEGRALGADAAGKVLAKAMANARRKGRSARFQVRVVDDYRHTCALTGYRCFTADGSSIVDAAHIESWAATQNDELTNGLALSKSAHWMFDQGLWSVDDDLRVVVHPQRFMEAGPEAAGAASREQRPEARGQSVRKPSRDPQARLRPSLGNLRRHRMRHF